MTTYSNNAPLRKVPIFWQRFETLLIFALIALFFAWMFWPLLWVAIENQRLVAVFYSDETIHFRLIKKALSERSLMIYFESYGHLYFNITLLPLYIISFFTNLSDVEIMFALRLVPALFGSMTAVTTFFLARRYFGSLAGWVSFVLLLTLPLEFLTRSVISNVDVPQIFFLTLGIFFCIQFADQSRLRWLFLASVAAGLAFACKYSGLFLLPLVWLLAIGHLLLRNKQPIAYLDTRLVAQVARYATAGIGVIGIIVGIVVTPELGIAVHLLTSDGGFTDPINLLLLQRLQMITFGISAMMLLLVMIGPIWRMFQKTPILSQALVMLAATSGFFILAFSVSSPFSYARLAFIQGIVRESRDKGIGLSLAADTNGLLWFDVLLSPHIINPFVMTLIVLSFTLVIWAFVKKGWKAIFTPTFILWFWVAFYLTYLILRVNYRPPHYLLPIVPFLCILAAVPFGMVSKFFSNHLQGWRYYATTAFVVLMVASFQAPILFNHVTNFRTAQLQREKNHPMVKAGNWIQENYPLSTRILYGLYTYVPTRFTSTAGSDRTLKKMLEFDPDIVVVNVHEMSTYEDATKAEQFVLGANIFLERYDYYKTLKNPSGDYKLVYDSPKVYIYEHKR